MSRTDLVVTVYRGREGTFVDLEYNTDLFDQATIARIGRWYERLLTDAVRHPDRRLSELALLAADERTLLIEGWNDTAADYPREPVHRQFEALADAHPDARAVLVPAEGDAPVALAQSAAADPDHLAQGAQLVEHARVEALHAGGQHALLELRERERDAFELRHDVFEPTRIGVT